MFDSSSGCVLKYDSKNQSVFRIQGIKTKDVELVWCFAQDHWITECNPILSISILTLSLFFYWIRIFLNILNKYWIETGNNKWKILGTKCINTISWWKYWNIFHRNDLRVLHHSVKWSEVNFFLPSFLWLQYILLKEKLHLLKHCRLLRNFQRKKTQLQTNQTTKNRNISFYGCNEMSTVVSKAWCSIFAVTNATEFTENTIIFFFLANAPPSTKVSYASSNIRDGTRVGIFN